MSSEPPDNQAFSPEDAAYAGSSYADVRQALFANPYGSPLPVHRVTLGSVLRGILPFGLPYAFAEASKRAIDSSADLRWGADRRGFRRLLHPNGICLMGLWNISEDTNYSGYF